MANKEAEDSADPFKQRKGYERLHLTPEQVAERRAYAAEAAKKGPPRHVVSGDDLSGTILAASVLDNGNLLVAMTISGTLSRPEGQWQPTGGTINVEIPAKKITGD